MCKEKKSYLKEYVCLHEYEDKIDFKRQIFRRDTGHYIMETHLDKRVNPSRRYNNYALNKRV